MKLLNVIREWIALAVVIVAVVVAARWFERREEVRDVRVQARIAQLDSTIARLNRYKARVDTQYIVAKTIYQHTTDSVIREIAMIPGDSVSKENATTAINKTKASCDATLLACEQRVAIRDSLLDSLRSKSRLLANHPIPPPPRWTFYVAGFRDVRTTAYGGRFGSLYQILGPISAFIEGDIATSDSLSWNARGGIVVNRRF